MTFVMVKDSGKRNVLVGVRFDSSHTAELIDWAVVKVADPGDCVVAIHVCSNSDSNAEGKYSLDSYMDGYSGICTEKQVHLKAQVLKGSSIRKVLVREAKKNGAVAVIVGTSMAVALGGRTSIAKYCARRLPTSVEVMAIDNGRIVFRRGPNSRQCTGAAGDPRPSIFYKEGSSMLWDSQSEPGGMGRRSLRQILREEDRGDDTKDVGCDIEPGWPLLRTEPLKNKVWHNLIPPRDDTALAKLVRKMSVVQWVMTLPNRSLLHSPRSHYRPKSESTSEEEEEEENGSFSDKSGNSDSKILIDLNSSAFKWFSYSVLRASTCQFSSENLISEGGCNKVYKGLLPNGKRVAVKILKLSQETWADFTREIGIMAAVKHKNIVPLLGICIKDNDLISVYNLFSKGNLEENLHGKGKTKSLLSWPVRFRIAIEIAEALNYLHNECPEPIIHRDVKSSNILLGDQFEPKLSDFGLAIWGPTTTPFVTHTDVLGTFGYLAPEYFMYGKVSNKIDVYSFGVVLLELLSGRRAIGFETRGGQESLVMWAKPKLERGNLKGILDENLNVNGDDESLVQRMGLAARMCLTQSARTRPNIGQILKMIRGGKDIDEEMHIQAENQHDLKNMEMDGNDDEVYPELSAAESHLSLALLDVNECSSSSFSSVDHSSPPSVEAYMNKRWSRSSSSFD
ncbi:unnamed protein product [Cuscuta campestris]|uniref:Protein kinase domain-containing protein n=1 Tax=Cuscuta campestris TaxID=132261 RepID=A0A484KX60_9ASTE|nr:unnamed protein product [Cuscuta campestris]